MPPSPRGERSHRKTDAERLRLFNLSRQLRTNLQYAKLKVERGWTKQSLPEVENLYFHYRSKGREPPHTHRAATARPRGNTKGQPRVPHPTQDVTSTPMATVADVLASVTPGQSSPATGQLGGTNAVGPSRRTNGYDVSTQQGDVEMSSQGDADADGEMEEDDPLATPTVARPTTPTRNPQALPSTPGPAVLPFQPVTALASPANIFPSRSQFSAPPITSSLASTSASPSGQPGIIAGPLSVASVDISRIPPAVVASFAAQQGFQPSQVQAMLSALAASGQLAQLTASVPSGAAPGRSGAPSTAVAPGTPGDNSRTSVPPVATPGRAGARPNLKGPAAGPSKVSTTKPANPVGLGSPLNVSSNSKSNAGPNSNKPGGGGGGSSLTYETFWQNHTADTKKYESLLNHPNPALAAAAASYLKANAIPPPPTPAALLPSVPLHFSSRHRSPGPGAGSANTVQDPAARAARLGVSRRPSPTPDLTSASGDGEHGSRARSRTTSVRSAAG